MRLTKLTSLFFLAACFSNEAGAVKNPYSVLGPKRVQAAEDTPPKASPPKGSSPKGVSPKASPPRESLQDEEIFNLSPTQEGPFQLENRHDLRVPPKGPSLADKKLDLHPPMKKQKTGDKPNHGTVLEFTSNSESEWSWKPRSPSDEDDLKPSSGQASMDRARKIISWDDAVKKGKEVWGKLQMALRIHAPDKVASMSTLKSNRWSFRHQIFQPDQDLRQILSQLKLATGPVSYTLREATHAAPPVPRWRGGRTTVYRNAFNPRQGVIIAENNFKSATETTHWSEVVFTLWHAYTWHRGDPSNLNYIVRNNVENADTKSIIYEAHWRAGKPLSDSIRLWREGFENDAFFALLGTPNGKGVARMLADYNHALKRKTIQGIYTVMSKDKQLHMILALGSADFPIPSRISAKSVDAARRIELRTQSSPISIPKTQTASMGHQMMTRFEARSEHPARIRLWRRQYDLAAPDSPLP